MSTSPPELPPRWPRGRLSRALTSAMLAAERLVGLLIPPAYNPLSQAGAAATLCLLISLVSGILLLCWYVPSVHEAADSLRALGLLGPGAWVRALHRWSSDAAMAFLLWHGARMGVEGRVRGPRWLAWITGLLLWVGVWFSGWIGFWMAWDERGLAVALTSARVVDAAAPLLGDMLERSLLADSSVSSSVFFILFFTHMLLPLALGIILWMHLRRVSRATLLPSRPVTRALCAALALIALIAPLPLEPGAALGSIPSPGSLDLWYLWPLLLAMRAGEGALIPITALILGGLAALPWLPRRASAPVLIAAVLERRCNGCTQCIQDCPFGALSLALAADGSGRLVARVDPELCTGCGVCVGSCDPVAIDLPDLPAIAARLQVDRQLDQALAERPDQPVTLVFICASAAQAPPADGRVQVVIPCIGWLHPVSIERALRRGAAHVEVVRCRDHDQPAREGARWLDARLAGERHPEPRQKLLPAQLSQSSAPPGVAPRPARSAASGHLRMALTAALLIGASVLIARLPTCAAPDPRAELVVALRHRALPIERCVPRSPEELAALPPHMRTPLICSRERPPAQLRLWVDGAPLLDDLLVPGGLSADGSSIALHRLRLEPGQHALKVQLVVGERRYERAVTLALEPSARYALVMDDGSGWRLLSGGHDVDHGTTSLRE